MRQIRFAASRSSSAIEPKGCLPKRLFLPRLRIKGLSDENPFAFGASHNGLPRQTRAAESQPADLTKNISEMKIRPSWHVTRRPSLIAPRTDPHERSLARLLSRMNGGQAYSLSAHSPTRGTRAVPLSVGCMPDGRVFSLISSLPSSLSADVLSVFVRMIHRYYAAVRLLADVHAGRVA